MKNSARFQMVIEIIDQILDCSEIPCDRLLVNFFRQRRFMGSHDRRAITDYVYHILRIWPLLTFYRTPLNGRQAVLGFIRLTDSNFPITLKEIFQGEEYGPAPLSTREQSELAFKEGGPAPEWAQAWTPSWLWSYCQDSFGERTFDEIQALNQPVGFDVRINSLRTDRSRVLKRFQQDQVMATATPYSPLGIRLSHRQALQNHFLFQEGYVEVQDEGSQLIALLTDAQPGMTVLDLCAGAGGKTLALAASMQNKGVLLATDVYEWRLKKAKERLKRAGIHNVECRLLGDSWLKRQKNRFERVLVDAPCSGTGTWRRNPDMKLRFQPSDLQDLLQKQQTILNTAADTVKPGGRLVYATCSMLRVENHKQVDHFLTLHPDFHLLDIRDLWRKVLGTACPSDQPVLQLTPARHQTDGFFISVLEKKV